MEMTIKTFPLESRAAGRDAARQVLPFYYDARRNESKR